MTPKMSLSSSRAMLRQSRLVGRTARRFESTTAKATEAAKDTASKAASTASEYTSKASQGLSRVTSSAGPAISGAAKSVSTTLSRVGGRTGRMIQFVESSMADARASGQIPLAFYYGRVGLELSKLVFQGQKMAPPRISTFQAYFQRLVKGVRNPGSLFSSASVATGAAPESALNQIRNINSAQLAAGGVLLAEVLGFFTVGEMIGRFKIVGYRGDTGGHH